jgi:hypothetical protein
LFCCIIIAIIASAAAVVYVIAFVMAKVKKVNITVTFDTEPSPSVRVPWMGA